MNQLIFSFIFLISSLPLLISTLDIPNHIVVSKDYTGTRKSLTVFDGDCEKLAKVKKNCHSWNNDVLVYDKSGKGDVIVSTDYSKGLFDDDTMKIYVGDHREHQYTLIFGFYDKLTAIFTFGDDISMLIFDPRIRTGAIVHPDFGKLIAEVDGTTFTTHILTISEPINSTTLYSISNNAYNLQINPCRSKVPFASSFYTVDASDNSNGILPKEIFIGMLSSLILNLAEDSGKRDACSSWHLYGKWLFMALMIVVGLIGLFCVYRRVKSGKCRGNCTRKFKEKFAFLDVETYPVKEKKLSYNEMMEKERVEEQARREREEMEAIQKHSNDNNNSDNPIHLDTPITDTPMTNASDVGIGSNNDNY